MGFDFLRDLPRGRRVRFHRDICRGKRHARILFFIFLVIFVVFLVLALVAGEAIF